MDCYLEMFPQLELKIFVGSCFEISILYYPISNFPTQRHPNPSPLQSPLPESLTISRASVGVMAQEYGNNTIFAITTSPKRMYRSFIFH